MATDKNISLLINVAGRERMLTEKISKKVMEYVYMNEEGTRDEIVETGKEFQDNLEGLLSVKENLGLDKGAASDLDKHLKKVEDQWRMLQIDINQIITVAGKEELLLEQINTKSDHMINSLDIIVSLIERKGNQSVQGLTTENIVLAFTNILFLIILFVIWRLVSGLSKSERKYRLLIKHSPIGIIMVKNNKVSFVNQYALQVLGFMEERDLIGKDVFTYVHPDYHAQAEKRLLPVYDKRQVIDLKEEKWVNKKGETIIVEVNTIPFDIADDSAYLTVFRDITDQENSKNELEHTYKELNDIKAALDRSSIVEIANNKGVIQYVNERFCEMSKFTKEELIGQTYKAINSGYHKREFFQNLWETITAGRVWEGQVRNRTKDGCYYWTDTTIIPFINSKGEPYQYLAFRNDITKRKQAEEEMERLATQDHLTHLSNRRVFEYELQRAIDRKESVAVLFIDLDRFKYINDSLGHSLGDKLIKLVAKRLKKVVDKNAIVSRQGGDEFTILVRSNNKDNIENLAKDILKRIKQPFYVAKKEILITCSIGISFYPEHGNSVETLMQNADIAMYWCKENGKDGFSFYEKHMRENTDRIMTLEMELRKAIDNEEFILFYQPKVDLFTNKVVGCDALIRWDHPKIGIISPGEFIPLAEETSLIDKIGEWVLKEACSQNKKWHEAGYSNFVISVNLSAHQFKQPNLVKMINGILKEVNLEPKFLEIEITESISMLSEEQILKQLYALKELGISIAIDDFGTGYSSLQYLDKLPVDTLKIDKSFINNIGKSDHISSFLMTNAIICLAKSLNMKVVAEGIETGEQMIYLKQYHCDIGQGYYISKPLPVEKIDEYLYTQYSDTSLSIAHSK